MNLRYAFILLFSIALASCSTTSVSGEEELFENQAKTLEEITIELSAQEQELFNLVNQHRTSMGMGTLEFSEEAYKYALEHNEHMIGEGELSHDNFSSRAAEIAEETAAEHVAENVARNYPLAEMALEGWLDSAAHKETIEGNFTHTALSIELDTGGNPYYTQIFLRK